MATTLTYRTSPLPALLAVAIASAIPIAVGAQESFDYTYTEVVDRIAELPAGIDLSQLSEYDLTRISYQIPDTSRVSIGYSDERGVYQEWSLLNPRVRWANWDEGLIARTVSDATGRKSYDERGRLLSVTEAPPLSDDLRGQTAAARRGEVTPYRPSFYPEPWMIESYLDAGFEIVDQPLAKRTGTGADVGLDNYRTLQVNPALTLVADDLRITFDTVAHIETSASYEEDGSLDYFTATKYAGLTLADGSVGYFITEQLEVRPDSLTTGERIARTSIRRHRDHSYRVNGVKLLGAAAAGSDADIAIFPNPVLEGQVNVLLPTAVSGIATVILEDINGRVVSREQYPITEGATLLGRLPADVAPGSYALSVTLGHETWSKLVVIQ